MFSKTSTITQVTNDDARMRLRIMKNWYSSLTLAEKSVAVTSIDKDLVNLFKAMQLKYAQHGSRGKFTAHT
jgi:hypothetical protein